ncbi:E3 ubiquitin ligase [Saitoella coloradoensis]
MTSAAPQSPSTLLRREVSSKNDHFVALTSHITKLRQSLTCEVCTELLYEPCTLACGHVQCYGCLMDWLQHKKTCPQCRAKVVDKPVLTFVIRDMVDLFVSKAEVDDPEGEGRMLREHQKEQRVMVEEHRASEQGLFPGLFKARYQGTRMMDPGDQVMRCASCGWEVEGGPSCLHCGYVFSSDSEAESYESLEDSNTDENEDEEGEDVDEMVEDFEGWDDEDEHSQHEPRLFGPPSRTHRAGSYIDDEYAQDMYDGVAMDEDEAQDFTEERVEYNGPGSADASDEEEENEGYRVRSRWVDNVAEEDDGEDDDDDSIHGPPGYGGGDDGPYDHGDTIGDHDELDPDEPNEYDVDDSFLDGRGTSDIERSQGYTGEDILDDGSEDAEQCWTQGPRSRRRTGAPGRRLRRNPQDVSVISINSGSEEEEDEEKSTQDSRKRRRDSVSDGCSEESEGANGRRRRLVRERSTTPNWGNAKGNAGGRRRIVIDDSDEE